MPAVVLESVSKLFHHRPALFNWFGRERTGETRALNNVSLEVPTGRVLVLLGPNGSGKTTTLKLISTMLLPDFGRIYVHGTDTTTNAEIVRERVGFAVATERSFFPRLSARENLALFGAIYNMRGAALAHAMESAFEVAGLADRAEDRVRL